MQFRIIKLTNNDDPKEFTLEITRMRDIRQRIGIIVADYNNYLLLEGKKYKPSYTILSNPNYSFYTVFRGHFDTYHECKQKRDELYDVYNKKAMNNLPFELTISFGVAHILPSPFFTSPPGAGIKTILSAFL